MNILHLKFVYLILNDLQEVAMAHQYSESLSQYFHEGCVRKSKQALEYSAPVLGIM
jgi:hypothetical protein